MIDKNVKKYIELMYTKDSELNKIQNLDERKKVACEKAGLDFEKSQHIVLLTDKDVREQIFKFLEANSPNEYMMLVSDEQLFVDMQHMKMEPLQLKDGENTVDDDRRLKNMNLKNTLSENSEKILDRINRTREKVYKDPEIIEASKDKIRMLKPEERLKK